MLWLLIFNETIKMNGKQNLVKNKTEFEGKKYLFLFLLKF